MNQHVLNPGAQGVAVESSAGQTQDRGNTKVGVRLRLVPAGVERIDGKSYMSAALLISPGPRGGVACAEVDLANWPTDVERLLFGSNAATSVRADIVPADPTLKACPDVPGGNGLRVMLRTTMSAEQRQRDLEAITGMWQALLGPGQAAFQALRSEVAPDLPQNSFERQVSKALDPTPTASEAQAPGPNVLNAARGVLGVMLPLERAHCLKLRLKAISSTAMRPPETNLAYVPVDPWDAQQSWPSFLGEPPLVRQLAQNVGPTATDADPQRYAQPHRQNILNSERDAAKAAANQPPAGLLQTRRQASIPQEVIQLGESKASVAMSRAIDRELDRHLLTTTRDGEDLARHRQKTPAPGEVPKPPDEDNRPETVTIKPNDVRLKFAAIQAQPSLARLFNLVRDVLIEWDSTAVSMLPGMNAVRFGYVSAGLAGAQSGNGGQRIWVATKFRTAGEGDAWPCTTDEVAIRLAVPNQVGTLPVDGSLDQSDGFVPLGSVSIESNQPVYRYELITLDVERAAEQRIAAEAARFDFSVDKNDPNDERVNPVQLTDRNRLLTLRTAGIAVVDRQRSIDVARAIRRNAKRAHNTGCVVGAEDLVVGYRLDVARPEGTGQISAWHPLCNRRIQFGEPRQQGDFGRDSIEAMLSRLEPDRVRRARLDAANIAPATRLETRDQVMTGHVEDQIARWLGLPLGADTDTDPGYVFERAANPPGRVIRQVRLDQPGALPLSQTISLGQPDGWQNRNSENWKSLRLLFGERYHFQMRVVLSGGVVRGINDARWAEKPDAVRLPGVADQNSFRFRRHERIERPLVSTPLPFLSTSFDGLTDGVRETGGSAILRSVASPSGGAGSDPRERKRTVRLFAPPPVASEFAELHRNAFDEATVVNYRKRIDGPVVNKQKVIGLAWEGPRDGLRDLNYSHPAGGFPVFTFDRSMKGQIDNDSRLKPNGDAVCVPVINDGQRAEPLYPDPAAMFMVFRLRDASRQFTDDPPVVVRLRNDGDLATNCRPVAVEFLAGRQPKANTARRSRLWAGTGLAPVRQTGSTPVAPTNMSPAAYMDANGAISAAKPSGAATAVSLVRVELAPGESFELVAWCIPDAKMLARVFEVVNGLATLGPDKADACFWNPEIKRSGSLPAQFPSSPVCFPAHAPPSSDAVKAAAERCFAELGKEPLPELVATAQVNITHALDKPHEAPVPGIKLVRLSENQMAAALKWGSVDQPEPPKPGSGAELPEIQLDLPTFFGTDSDGKPLKVVPRSVDVLVSGDLQLERETTGFVEIIASGPCLISGKLDDVSRKRTSADVLRGSWPVDRTIIDPATDKPPGKTITSVYGFSVDRIGRVSHPPEKATLLRVDDAPLLSSPPPGTALLPGEKPDGQSAPARSHDEKEISAEQIKAAQPAKRKLRDIQALSQIEKERSVKDRRDTLLPRANPPTSIRDTLARILTLEVQAGSRTSSYFRDPKTGAVYSGEQACLRVAQPGRIAIPATAAPEPVVPRSIVPSFKPEDPRDAREVQGQGRFTVSVSRQVRLRIRLQRPWFSSGVGERLGIILWPPDLMVGATNRVVDGNAVLRGYELEPGAPKDADKIMLTGIEDHKLPPEWAFVTRWGMDPIRERPTKLPTLLSPADLPAVTHKDTRWHDAISAPAGTAWNILGDMEPSPTGKTTTPEIERDVVYVGRASVPFPTAHTGPDGEQVERRFFEAALLTFRPRFDLDGECWYCDLDIHAKGVSFPFVRLGLVRYQPLAPKELQVSAPIVDWAQIPPDRTVKVSQSASRPNIIELEVRGSGTAMAAPAPPESLMSWLHKPALKVTLCWRDANGRENVARLGRFGAGASQGAVAGAPPLAGGDIGAVYWDDDGFSPFAAFDYIPETQGDWEDYLARRNPDDVEPLRKRAALRSTDSPAQQNVGELVWKAAFVLDRAPSPLSDGDFLVVHVEEVEPMLPASYPEEPFDERDPDRRTEARIVVSGPKFATRVEFKR